VKALCAATLGVFLLCGCSIRHVVVREVTGLAETGLTAMEADDDLPMLEAAFPANIKMFEGLLASDPHNVRLLVLLSRLYGSYAFAFTETTLEARLLSPDAKPGASAAINERVSRYYLKGAQYAIRALEVDFPNCRKRLERVGDQDRFFARIQKSDLPALFWYGFNLGGFVNRNLDSVTAISKAHLAKSAMERVLTLDPGYFHGGAHLFLMVYYGSRSPMLGGSPQKAKAYYEALKTLAGTHFYLADVLWARYGLRQIQDRKGAEAIFRRVAASPDPPAAYRLLNAVAIARARIYLGAMDELFP
jgi:hypothetical protein